MLVGEYSTEDGIKIYINEQGGNLFLKVEGQNQFMVQKLAEMKHPRCTITISIMLADYFT
jgi:hypothetical protein